MTPAEAFATYETRLESPGLTMSQLAEAEAAFLATLDPSKGAEYAEPLQRVLVKLGTLGFGKGASLARVGVNVALLAGGVPSFLEALLSRIDNVLEAAERFVIAVEADQRAIIEQDAGESALSVGPILVPESWWRRFGEADAEAVWAYRSAEPWLSVLLALAAREPFVRQALLNSSAERVVQFAQISDNARALRSLVLCPDREKLLFVHLPTRRVFELEMHEIGINFELHVLLSAALAESLGHRRPPQHVLDVTGGVQAPPNPPDVKGTWDFFSFRAARPLIQREKPSIDDIVWNEGIPFDIPKYEGTRMILATPEAAPRRWGAGRAFRELKPSVKLLAEIPEREAHALIEQLVFRAD